LLALKCLLETMCSVQGGVQVVKDVHGLVTAPMTWLTSKVQTSVFGEDSSSSSSEDSSDDEAPKKGIPMAQTTHPQTLSFMAPDDAAPGGPVCVQGPHGPIKIPLPADVQPGKPVSVRLGPPDHYTIPVPEGAEPGTTVHFTGEQGETLHAVVPQGLKAGDELKVSPPVLLVQVPPKTKPGQQVAYVSPFGHRLVTVVPSGLSPGHYFSALYEIPQQNQPQQAPMAPVMGTPVSTVSTEPKSATEMGYAAQPHVAQPPPPVAPPQGAQPPPPAAPPPPTTPPPAHLTPWRAYATAAGLPYYHNSTTGVTQWECPPDLKAAAPSAKAA